MYTAPSLTLITLHNSGTLATLAHRLAPSPTLPPRSPFPTHSANGRDVVGELAWLRGEATGLRGEATGLRGEVTRLRRELAASTAAFARTRALLCARDVAFC